MDPLDSNAVGTRDDLGAFLRELARQATDNLDAFENRTVPDYLEAASAWVVDMDGAFANLGKLVPETPTWALVAQIFLAATAYE